MVQDGCFTSSSYIKIPAVRMEGMEKMVQKKHSSRLFRKIPLMEYWPEFRNMAPTLISIVFILGGQIPS